MLINVTGEERVARAPERAVVSFAVTASGADRQSVVRDVAERADRLHAALTALGGSVSRIAIQPLRTYSNLAEDGRLEVSAGVDAAATFADFDLLGRLVADLAASGDADVRWVDWRLREETVRALTDECVTGAVTDARRRAAAIADAAGAVEIRIEEITDQSGAYGGGPRMMAMGAAYNAAPEIVPQDIEVSVTLAVRFSAS